ncbi:hypothetical protein [Asaia astilbis]|uniref:hypothetical protein n=1 Tax=Asaia astilbis TaxID=610244 RepID=UPI000470F821|nr:hypothetical protein [Asaia astilbis]
MKTGSPPPAETPTAAASRIMQGVWQLARGDEQGMNAFRNTSEALLAAIAPSAALFLVMAVPQALKGYHPTDIIKILILMTALLTRLVVSQFAATFWGRAALWPRYATAQLWSSWLPMVLSLFVLALLQMVTPGLGSSRGAFAGVMLGVELYELWLSWFVARAGLQIGGGKAALLVVLINVSMALLYLLAALLPPHYNALSEIMAATPKS